MNRAEVTLGSILVQPPCPNGSVKFSQYIHPLFFQRDLTKRRENKARAELAGKTDKVNTLRQEIAENENQLNMAQVDEDCYKSLYISSQLVFHQQKFRKSLGIFYINPKIIRV